MIQTWFTKVPLILVFRIIVCSYIILRCYQVCKIWCFRRSIVDALSLGSAMSWNSTVIKNDSSFQAHHYASWSSIYKEYIGILIWGPKISRYSSNLFKRQKFVDRGQLSWWIFDCCRPELTLVHGALYLRDFSGPRSTLYLSIRYFQVPYF